MNVMTEIVTIFIQILIVIYLIYELYNYCISKRIKATGKILKIRITDVLLTGIIIFINIFVIVIFIL